MKRTRSLPIILQAIVCLVVVSEAAARSWNVPAEVPTIQAAIDSAVVGDEVLIAAGTYNDCTHANSNNVLHCMILKSGVDIRGATGDPADVIIDAQGLGRVAEARNLTTEISLSGLTLTGGHAVNPFGSGGGLFCYNSTPHFENCVIHTNYASYAGAGLHLSYSTATVTDCLIYNNTTDLSGAGIRCHNSEVEISGCTFYGNDGAGIYYSTQAPTISNTIIAASTGMAISRNSTSDDPPVLTCSDLYGNEEDFGEFLADLEDVDGNFSADPLFCNPLFDDFTLYSASWCAEEYNPECGQIGALPVACGLGEMDYIVVPDGTGDFPTIQAAINAAADGDTISLEDGVFTGDGNRDLDYLGKGLTIRSRNGNPTDCVIDCQGSPGDEHRGFHFHMGEEIYSALLGVTITNGDVGEMGGGILCESSPVIENCILVQNHADLGAGIHCDGGSPTINNCIIRQNEGRVQGGGIGCFDSEAVITDTIISRNWGYFGGAIFCPDSSDVTLEGCSLLANNSSLDRAAIGLDGISALTITRTIIAHGNRGSIRNYGYGLVVISGCDVFGNADFNYGDVIAGQEGVNGNLSLDPLFCDLENDDFSLFNSSPCAEYNGPDGLRIGALGVACFEAEEFTDVTVAPLDNADQGQAVAWVDYDGDQDLDLYLVNDGQANQLYANDGDAFTAAVDHGLEDTGSGRGQAWADYDDDGAVDLYLTNFDQPNRLFHNMGDGTFTEIECAALADSGAGQAATWADFNADGDLDLFLANLDSTSKLFEADTTDLFIDVTDSPLTWIRQCTAASWVDVDGDNDLDLYAVNADQANQLFEFNAGTFTLNNGVLANADAGQAAAWGDYDNDGDMDVYVVNNGQANVLYRNQGNGNFTDVTSSPLADTGHGRTALWGDYDNDGDLDLFLTNQGEADRLLENQGADDLFFDNGSELLRDTGNSTGATWGDYDGDGDLDLYIARDGAPNRLLRNDTLNDNHWLHVDLVGFEGNLSAIGAKVEVMTGDTTRVRVVTGGNGCWSQDSATLEFGLGAATVVDSMAIFWPDGSTQSMNDVAVDQRLMVTEPTTAVDEAELQEVFTAYPCYPNPFNPRTTLVYNLPAPAEVSIRVFDLRGRLVRVLLADELQLAGHHRSVWDGRDDRKHPVSAGLYLLRITAADFAATRRALLVK